MDELDEINQMDEALQSYEVILTTTLIALNALLVDAVRDLLDRLELHGRATTAAQVRSNQRIVMMWRADLPGLLDRLGYTRLISELVGQMGTSAERLNAYYVRMGVEFNPADYSELLAGLIAQTRALMTQTVVGTYGPILDEVLTWGVLSKSTGAEMRTAILAKLPTEGMAVRHIGQVASYALYTFSRGYAQAVAEGLNLKHYYYMGTQIATTRSFCSDRFGKAFTSTEVEQWPDLTWSGKIPGTTKLSIYWYCGGFRCRHRLLPITKRLYQQFISKH